VLLSNFARGAIQIPLVIVTVIKQQSQQHIYVQNGGPAEQWQTSLWQTCNWPPPLNLRTWWRYIN